MSPIIVILISITAFGLGMMIQKIMDKPIYVPENYPHQGDVPHVHDHDLKKDEQ